jgi:hypothetical protein
MDRVERISKSTILAEESRANIQAFSRDDYTPVIIPGDERSFQEGFGLYNSSDFAYMPPFKGGFSAPTDSNNERNREQDREDSSQHSSEQSSGYDNENIDTNPERLEYGDSYDDGQVRHNSNSFDFDSVGRSSDRVSSDSNSYSNSYSNSDFNGNFDSRSNSYEIPSNSGSIPQYPSHNLDYYDSAQNGGTYGGQNPYGVQNGFNNQNYYDQDHSNQPYQYPNEYPPNQMQGYTGTRRTFMRGMYAYPLFFRSFSDMVCCI